MGKIVELKKEITKTKVKSALSLAAFTVGLSSTILTNTLFVHSGSTFVILIECLLAAATVLSVFKKVSYSKKIDNLTDERNFLIGKEENNF